MRADEAQIVVDGFADWVFGSTSGSGSGAAISPSLTARSSTALRRA